MAWWWPHSRNWYPWDSMKFLVCYSPFFLYNVRTSWRFYYFFLYCLCVTNVGDHYGNSYIINCCAEKINCCCIVCKFFIHDILGLPGLLQPSILPCRISCNKPYRWLFLNICPKYSGIQHIFSNYCEKQNLFQYPQLLRHFYLKQDNIKGCLWNKFRHNQFYLSWYEKTFRPRKNVNNSNLQLSKKKLRQNYRKWS